jgi:hypothetical protein
MHIHAVVECLDGGKQTINMETDRGRLTGERGRKERVTGRVSAGKG